jgi:DNA-binding response OmpR family regulator
MPEPTNILIIDDDQDICDTVQIVLELRGYRVTTASNGEEGLRLLRNGERPGLILLDLMMPGMNGTQFREEQLRDSTLASIPVLVLSGDGRVAEKAAPLKAEGLVKPLHLETLLEKIRGLCPSDGTP